MNDNYLSFEDFLKMILSVLEKAGIDYMIGGAVAVWPWGEPRSTQDIDIVIHLGIEQINSLSKELEKVEIYLPPDIILENLQETRIDLPINAIHGSSGFKAEMYLLREDDELRKTTFQRRVKVDFGAEHVIARSAATKQSTVNEEKVPEQGSATTGKERPSRDDILQRIFSHPNLPAQMDEWRSLGMLDETITLKQITATDLVHPYNSRDQ